MIPVMEKQDAEREEGWPVAPHRWQYGLRSLDDSHCPTLLRGCLLALVDATPGIVMVSSSRGRLLYMNDMGRRLLGLAPEVSVVARTVFDVYAPHSCDQLLGEAIPTCLHSGLWRGEMTLVDSARTEIPVSQVLMAHHVREADGGETTVLSSIAWDIRDMKQTEQQLRHQATHDPLTGLPNRALLLERLGHALRVAELNQTFVAVLFLDLDGFKQINDNLGHETADILLREFGQRLRARVRVQDTVARYGGDEFVVLLTDLAAPGDINRALQQIRSAVHEPFPVGREQLRVAASIGLAMYPLDGQDAETLLRRADGKMYEQKRLVKVAS
jgi:diguanylate cyclase (GGDEF)-like protein